VSFKRNVIMLAGSGFIAQALPVLLSPILTRLYEPSVFGEYSLITSIIILLSILATGRYELAMFADGGKDEKLRIVSLCWLWSFVFALLSLGVLAFLYVIEWQYFSLIYLLIPFGLFFYATYQVNYCFQNSEANYKFMVRLRVMHSVILITSQLVFGLLISSPSGMLLGFILSYVLIYYLNIRLGVNAKLIPNFKSKFYIELMTKHKKYPMFLLPGHFLNSLARLSPNLLLPVNYSFVDAGYFLLIQRVLGAPVSIIANSVSDVFKEEAAKSIRLNGNCHDIWVGTFKKLLFVGALGGVIGYIFIEPIILLLFGVEWSQSGVYAKILLPMFCFQFVASPLSCLFYICGKQRHDLGLQVVISLVTGPIFFLSPDIKTALTIYSVSYVAIYSYVIALTFVFSRGSSEEIID